MENNDELRFKELSKILHQRPLSKEEIEEWKNLNRKKQEEENHNNKNTFHGQNLLFV